LACVPSRSTPSTHRLERRQAEDPERRRDRVRRGAAPVSPSAEKCIRILGGEEHRSTGDFRVGQKPDLDRGDDGVATTAAPERVEQVAMVVLVHATNHSVRCDDFERAYVIDRQTVTTAIEGQPSAEQVPDDAYRGRGPVHCRQTMWL
jgi:hypothetical protein